MVKKRWPRIIGICILIIAIAVVSFFAFQYLSRNLLEQSTSQKLSTKTQYIVDSYGKVALRADSFVNAKVIDTINSGTVVTLLNDVDGPMSEISVSENKTGYIPDYLLLPSDSTAKRYGMKQLSAESTIYYVKRPSSLTLYNGCSEDGSVEKYVPIEYIPSGTPVSILNKNGEKGARIVNHENGMVGYISIEDIDTDIPNSIQSHSDISGATLSGKLRNGMVTVINTETALPAYSSSDPDAVITCFLRPGTWVMIDSFNKHYCKIHDYYNPEIAVYVMTSALYSPES